MNRDVTAYGRIQGGKLKISFHNNFLQAIQAFPDCRVSISVKRIYSSRSLEQNGYLHGVVFPELQNALIEVGYSPSEVTLEAVKDLMKYRFAKQEIVNEKTGEVMEIIQPTSQMTTVQMMAFIEEIRRFASEYLGHYIPAPNEQLEIK